MRTYCTPARAVYALDAESAALDPRLRVLHVSSLFEVKCVVFLSRVSDDRASLLHLPSQLGRHSSHVTRHLMPVLVPGQGSMGTPRALRRLALLV